MIPCQRSFTMLTIQISGIDDSNDRLRIYIGYNCEYRAEVNIRPVTIPERASADFVASLEPYQILIDQQKRGVAMKVEEYRSV